MTETPATDPNTNETNAGADAAPQAATAGAASAGSEDAPAEAPTASAAGANSDGGPWKAKADEWQTKATEAQDRMLRAQAELENYRKRSQREIADTYKYAPLPIIRDLLPVYDNAMLAIQASEKLRLFDERQVAAMLEQAQAGQPIGELLSGGMYPPSTSLLDGFRMVAQQMQNVFAQAGCQKIETLHQPFDPNKHEVIAQQPDASHPPMTIIYEVRGGFQLHDRVIRPAQVIVSSGPPA